MCREACQDCLSHRAVCFIRYKGLKALPRRFPVPLSPAAAQALKEENSTAVIITFASQRRSVSDRVFMVVVLFVFLGGL